MREPLLCRSAADIDDPLAEDRRIDEGLTPEPLRDEGTRSRQGPQGFVRVESDRALGGRPDVVVHHLQMQALQVRDVSRDVDRENLALPLIRSLRTNPEASY